MTSQKSIQNVLSAREFKCSVAIVWWTITRLHPEFTNFSSQRINDEDNITAIIIAFTNDDIFLEERQ